MALQWAGTNYRKGENGIKATSNRGPIILPTYVGRYYMAVSILNFRLLRKIQSVHPSRLAYVAIDRNEARRNYRVRLILTETLMEQF